MKKLVNGSVTAASLYLTTVGSQVMAACTADEKAKGCVDIISPTPDKTVFQYITGITDWILTIVGAIAVLFIIWAGVKYVTAGGNKERIDSAKQTLTYAVVGVVVVVLARVIIALVSGTALKLFG